VSQASTTEAVVEQLKLVLGSDDFPDEAKLLGTRLLDRLKSPVRIVVFGKPGSGKSRLINMLLGAPVYGRLADLTTCEIVHGAEQRMFITRQSGRVEEWSASPDKPLPDDVALARVELPLDCLKRFSLTEVTLAATTPGDRETARWAMDRADIALWCTQSFDAVEQALWMPARDSLKDHSFLVITKADQLLMKGVLAQKLADLESIVAEQFHSLYSVATIQAITAHGAGDSPDAEIWAASGGHALSQAVARQVDTGRRADADNALLFLRRYASVVSQIEHLRARAPDSDTPRERPMTKPLTVCAPPSGLTEAIPRNRAVFVEALEFLQERAENLLAQTGGDPSSVDPDLILNHCLETAQTLNTRLEEFDARDPALADLQTDLCESADMMFLLQLEHSTDAASDAITLLLQIKKEVAARTVG
jgi:hypothetical protein